MKHDDHLMFENYVDGITKRRGELAGNIMDIVKHGVPSKEEFIKIRQQLHRKVKEIQDRGTAATEQEKREGHRMMGQIRAYRSQHPDDPGPYAEENAENEPHGYPQGMTAIQNLVLNALKKHGFALTEIRHADKERDAYATVFMHKRHGPMHHVAEIDGMGAINGEPYKDYLANLKDGSEDAEETKQPYNAMNHLTQAANHIRDILQTNADDEAQEEHIIRMAQIILGSKSDYASDAEYRKMLDGLIAILNRFIMVPMN